MISPSLDLHSLREIYRAGTASPADIVRTIYSHIEECHHDAIWIHIIPEAEATARAKALGTFDDNKPLYGIPFAVKDNIDVAGLPTTAGCPDFAYVPEVTATVVQRLLDAGAILIGKTNLDQFATGLVGVRSPYGAPSSVFDKNYISGGSSSGSAVAVAVGLVSFSLGTDTAGSGRVPAAFNNIIGWKPTRGLVSTSGIVPACRSLDCPSVFTLTASDALEIATIVSAFDETDPYSRLAPERCPSFPSSFRFGIPASHELKFFGDNESESLFHQAVERLIVLGGTKVEIDFAPFREAASLLYSGPWVAERLAAVTPFIDEHPQALHPITRVIIEGGRRFTATDTFRAFYELEELCRFAAVEWERMDFMLLPTTGTMYTHQQIAKDPIGLNNELGFYTNFVNLLDLSGIAVPAGFRKNGLPFGVTFLGQAFQDEALCLLASRYQELTGTQPGATAKMAECRTPLRSAYSRKTSTETVPLAVVGAHLRGEPLNHQLLALGALFERTARTAPGYRLFALPETFPPKPGLVRDPTTEGPGIEVEIWRLAPEAFGRFTAAIAGPLGIGTITLDDGTDVHGFLCEWFATTQAEEITRFGGWLAFQKATDSTLSQLARM